MQPIELLFWLLGIAAALMTLGLVVFLVGLLIRTRRQGRTRSGHLIMESPVTVVKVRKLGSSAQADRELVLRLPDQMESTIVADAALGSKLKPGHKGTARWAAGRLLDFAHESKR